MHGFVETPLHELIAPCTKPEQSEGFATRSDIAEELVSELINRSYAGRMSCAPIFDNYPKLADSMVNFIDTNFCLPHHVT